MHYKFKSLVIWVYTASKSFITIRHCKDHVDLISYIRFIFLQKSLFLKNLITFSTSQFLLSNVFILPWLLFFLLSLHWRNYWMQGLIVKSLVSTCHICACWMLIIFWHQMSASLSSISNIQYGAYSTKPHIAYNCCEHFPILNT